MPTEVIPTNHPIDDDYVERSRPIRRPDAEAHLDELARDQGVRPFHDPASMPTIEVSDEEWDDWQRLLHQIRHGDCDCR